MELGKPLVEYGATNITELRAKMLRQPIVFWEFDRANRTKVAGNRPGNAVFFYNDKPTCVDRESLQEVKSGYVSVLRHADRPLFAEIQELIETNIKPCFPECDVMRVQLAELPPGAVIRPHRDVGILLLIHRLHVPLVTHEGVKFSIAGRVFLLGEGMLYDLNNAVLHSVENQSDVMRVHLMVDMIPHAVARTRYYDTEDAMVAALAMPGPSA